MSYADFLAEKVKRAHALGPSAKRVRLYSNPAETVLSPFAGIGSEGYISVRLGRKFIGCELKPSYWRTAIDNMQALDAELQAPSLMDLL